MSPHNEGFLEELQRAYRHFSGRSGYREKTQGPFICQEVVVGETPVFTINLNTGSVTRHPNLLYAAGCRARGAINRLPIEQRSEHYRRVTGAMNKWRPHITTRTPQSFPHGSD